MKSETDPITDDEWLLRRVRIEKFRTDQVPIISPNTFEPRVKGRDPDVHGISLYREACLDDPAKILATVAQDRQHEYGIVRIPIAILKSLQMSVVSSHDPLIAGHVVIPELNSAAYVADKARFTPIKERMATVASEDANIVRHPTAAPE